MITYNGITAPSYFKIIEFNDSLTPDISQTTVKVAGRPGVVDFGNEIDARKIEIKYMIKANNPVDLRAKARVIADWLSQEEDKELIYANEPNKYYMAKLTGQTELKETLHLGEGTLQFVCADPYAYSVSSKTSNIINGETTINNNGTATTEPVIDLTFTQDVAQLTLAANDEFMIFGEPAETGKTIVKTKPEVFRDIFEVYNGWTNAATLLDTGVITGSLTTIGQILVPTDIGEGGRWHGPAVVKAFSRPVQDFSLKSDIKLMPTKAGQLGRIMFSVRSGQNIVATMSLRSGNSNAITPYAQVLMGATGAVKVYEGYGNYSGYWKDYWDGSMNIERKGRKWTFTYGIYNATKKKYEKVRNVVYTDAKSQFMQKIDSIQVHMGGHGTSPLPPNFGVRDIIVNEIVTPTNPDLVEETFRAGDNLVINSQTGEVMLNRKPFYSSMNPSSQFIKLEKGANQLIIQPDIAVSGTVQFRERWK